MADIPLNIRMRVTGDVKKALLGVQKEATKAEKEIRKDLKRTADMRKKGYQENEMALRNSVGRQRQIMRKAAIETRNENKRTSREQEENMVRAAKRGSERAKTILRAAGVLGVGAAAGARSAFSRGSSFLGLPTQQQGFANATQYRVAFRQFANAAGMDSGERNRVMTGFRGKSEQTGVSEGELLEGAAMIQAKIGAQGLQAYEDNIDSLININQSLGVPMQDLAGVVVELQRQFKIGAEDLPEAIGFMVEAANEGSIEVRDFAGGMRDSMGLAAVVIGQGVNAWKTFVAASETVGTVIAPGEASTSVERGLDALTKLRAGLDPKFRGEPGIKKRARYARSLGLDANADPITFGKQLRDRGITESQLVALFPEIRAQKFMRTMRDQGQLGERLLGVSGETGLQTAKGQAAEFRTSPEGQMLARREEILRNVNEQFDAVAKAADKAAGSLSAFASQHVVFAQGMGVAIDALQAMGVAAIAWKFLKGGGGKKPPIGPGTLTTAAGGGGGTVAAGGVSGGLVAAGGLTVGLGAAALSAYGYNKLTPRADIGAMPPTAGNPFGMPVLFKKSADDLNAASSNIKQSTAEFKEVLRRGTPLGDSE